MKKNCFSVLTVLVISSFLLGACAPREVILTPDDPWTVANGGLPVSVSLDPIQRCLENGKTYPLDLEDEKGERLQITFCDSVRSHEGMQVDIVDMAMIGTLVTPWPGDEEIVGVIWIGKTVAKLVLVAGSAYVTGQGLAVLPGTINNNIVAVEVTGLQTINIEASLLTTHDPAHDIEKHLPEVTSMLTGFQTWVATGGPNQRDTNQNYRCVALVIGSQIARFVLWSKTTMNVLVWSADGEWVTFYGPKAQSALMKVPENVKGQYGSQASMQPISCNQLPPFPPLPIGG